MSDKNKEIFSIENLTAGYGKIPIIHDASLTLPVGSISAIIGPNGSGKSTFTLAMLNLVNIMSGKIFYRNKSITGLKTNKIVELGIGYVPQKNNVFSSLTVQENLEISAGNIGAQKIDECIEKIYEKFPRLKERKRLNGSSLSGGERQMLAIGSALIVSPDFLILDEPTTGLSPQLTNEVAEGIVEINKNGTTILWVVEENPRQILSFADWVYVMDSGTIKPAQLASEVLNSPNFRQLFLGI